MADKRAEEKQREETKRYLLERIKIGYFTIKTTDPADIAEARKKVTEYDDKLAGEHTIIKRKLNRLHEAAREAIYMGGDGEAALAAVREFEAEVEKAETVN